MFGDEEFGTSDLVGAEKGMHSTKVTDNFVRTVTKTEEFRRPHWVDSRLTTACRQGYTLVYDEFSRSRPEANNVLLTILEEGVLALPDTLHGATYKACTPTSAPSSPAIRGLRGVTRRRRAAGQQIRSSSIFCD